jgi:Zn-dependent protease with chaperone function
MKFQVVNTGLIISLLINFVISFFFVSIFVNDDALGLGITLLIFICSIGILYTSVGDWWYRKIVLNLREPNEAEARRLMPIYNEVYKRAITESPNLSKDIKLFVYDDDDINAFAIGLRTIAVHQGMLVNNIYDNEIAAILGHEFAHIANGDTFCTILAIQSNAIVSIFRTLFSFLMVIAAKIVGFFVALAFETAEGAENGFTIADACVRGLNWLLDKFVLIFVAISVIIAQYSRRQHELAADNFTARLGYGQPMINFFQRYEGCDGTSNVLSLSHLLYGTHPNMQIRIENLQSKINSNTIDTK